MQMYVIIPASQSEQAYYVYYDKNTSMYAVEAKMTLSYSLDGDGNESDEVNHIVLDCNSADDSKYDMYVQASSHTLTYNRNSVRLQLLITKAYYGYKDTINMKYERISTGTTLRDLEQKLSNNIPVISFDAARFHNNMYSRNLKVYSETDTDEYIYRVYKFNSITNEYICYYALKEEQEQHTYQGTFYVGPYAHQVVIDGHTYNIHYPDNEYAGYCVEDEKYFFIHQECTDEDYARWIEEYRLSTEISEQ